MNTPEIVAVDSLGEATYNSPLTGQISRFYNGEARASQDRTQDFSKLEGVQDIE